MLVSLAKAVRREREGRGEEEDGTERHWQCEERCAGRAQGEWSNVGIRDTPPGVATGSGTGCMYGWRRYGGVSVCTNREARGVVLFPCQDRRRMSKQVAARQAVAFGYGVN